MVAPLGNKNHYIHGLSGSRINVIFRGIKQRCRSKKRKDYAGRGIVCDWKSFQEFKNDMYKSYLKHVNEHGEKDTMIERIDNNKGYSKENCTWATRLEQNNNKRNVRKFLYKGKNLTLRQWSQKININYDCLRNRLDRKWTVERMLSTPIRITKNEK